MHLTELIDALSDPAAYPRSGAFEAVDVHQTHLSVVFLAGDRAYKIKKPVDLGFVDYRTLEQRRHFCELEVLLNRRLAPSVYLGVVPITHADGHICMEGEGPAEVVEWAVKMERLPDRATLREYLRRGELGVAQLEALAVRIAEFHRQADGGPKI